MLTFVHKTMVPLFLKEGRGSPAKEKRQGTVIGFVLLEITACIVVFSIGEYCDIIVLQKIELLLVVIQKVLFEL